MLGLNPGIGGVSLLLLVISDYVNAGLPCTFRVAGAVTVVYCETDCCDDTCCSQNQSDSSTSSIVLGVVAAVVLVVIGVVLVVCCCKHRFPCQSKKESSATGSVSPITERRGRVTRHDEVLSMQNIDNHPQEAETPFRSVRREGTFSIIQ